MPRIKVNPLEVAKISWRIGNAESAVKGVADDINYARWRVDGRITERRGIGSRLNQITNTVNQIESDMERIQNTINSGAFRYVTTENSIVAMERSITNPVKAQIVTGVTGITAPVAGAVVTVQKETESIWKRFWDGNLENGKNVSAWNNGKEEEEKGLHLSTWNAGWKTSAEGTIGAWEKDDLKEFSKKKEKPKVNKVYDRKTREELNPDDFDLPEKKATILEAKAEAKAEASAFEMKLDGEAKYADGKVDVKVGTAQAVAEASAGLYTYDVNGILLTAPAVDAKLGASISVLSAEAEGRFGWGEKHDALGLYGKGSVDVGKAAAEGSAGVQLFNKNGEVDVSAYAEGKLEAIAAEAKGSAGVTVLGADVGVTGSVNFGIGAHAKAGIEGGVVKIDVGVSVGLGASVGLEVDVGGAVKTVCSAAKSAWDDTKDFWKGVFS